MKMKKKKFEVEVPAEIYSLEKHLYSLMMSGVYISNIDIQKIMLQMDYDTPLHTRERLFEDLFKKSKAEGRIHEAFELLGRLVSQRIGYYERLASLYSEASKPIDLWLNRARHTLQRIQTEGSKDYNDQK